MCHTFNDSVKSLSNVVVVVVEKGRRHIKVNLRLNFWLTFVMHKKETSLSLTLKKKSRTNDNIIRDGHWTVGNIFVQVF